MGAPPLNLDASKIFKTFQRLGYPENVSQRRIFPSGRAFRGTSISRSVTLKESSELTFIKSRTSETLKDI